MPANTEAMEVETRNVVMLEKSIEYASSIRTLNDFVSADGEAAVGDVGNATGEAEVDILVVR
jgi:hypothetical protein